MSLLFYGPDQWENYIHVTAVTFVLVPLYVDVLSVTLDKYKEVFLNATQQVWKSYCHTWSVLGVLCTNPMKYIYIALHKHEVMFNAINRAKLGWPVMLMQHWYHKSGHTYMCEFCLLYIQHVYIMIGTHEHPVFKDIYTEFPLLIIVYYTKCHVDKVSMHLTEASFIVYRTHDCISSVGIGLWHGHGVSTVGQEIPIQWLKETLYYLKISREKTFVDR